MKRNLLIFSLVCGSVAIALAACGGVDSDLLTGSDDGGTSSDGSFGDSSSARDSSTARDSSSSSDGGSGGDATVTDSGIVKPKKDAGVLQCGDNGSTGGVGGTPVDCNTGDPICCASQYPFDMVNPVSFACTANEVSCADYDSGSIPIECRSNDDCPGATLCCGHEVTFDTTGTPVTVYESVHCATPAACPLFFADAGETAYRQFCSTTSAVNACPTGETCLQSTLLPGFNVCGN